MNTLSNSCIRAYQRQHPNDVIMREITNGLVFIESEGRVYNQPPEETDELFMERLKRCSKKDNLFLIDWPVNNMDYERIDI